MAVSCIYVLFMLIIRVLSNKRLLNMKSFSPISSRSSRINDPHPSLSNLRWFDLKVDKAELRPDFTLMMGQCFNWSPLFVPEHDIGGFDIKKEGGDMGISSEHIAWVGVLDGKPLAIRQLPDTTVFSLLSNNGNDVKTEDILSTEQCLKDYFQCNKSLSDLYERWGQGCSRMRQVLPCLPGVRVVRQDPFECLTSFICSSNNNIKRITQMLAKLRRCYGKYLGSLIVHGSQDSDNDKTWSYIYKDEIDVRGSLILDTLPALSKKEHDFFAFPTAEELAQVSQLEEKLKRLGYGYRAKFIAGTARLAAEKGNEWLHDLRHNRDRLEVQRELLTFPGVGPKVADCVALFSLDQSESIPVDTHVWDIAVRDYDSTLANNKSLTPKVYEMVGDEFRRRYVPHAGWAHSVLFAGELSEFKKLLPVTMVQEMELFAKEKREERIDKKKAKRKRKEERADKTSIGGGGSIKVKLEGLDDDVISHRKHHREIKA